MELLVRTIESYENYPVYLMILLSQPQYIGLRVRALNVNQFSFTVYQKILLYMRSSYCNEFQAEHSFHIYIYIYVIYQI